MRNSTVTRHRDHACNAAEWHRSADATTARERTSSGRTAAMARPASSASAAMNALRESTRALEPSTNTELQAARAARDAAEREKRTEDPTLDKFFAQKATKKNGC